jgi:hypothetical protein
MIRRLHERLAIPIECLVQDYKIKKAAPPRRGTSRTSRKLRPQGDSKASDEPPETSKNEPPHDVKQAEASTGGGPKPAAETLSDEQLEAAIVCAMLAGQGDVAAEVTRQLRARRAARPLPVNVVALRGRLVGR